MATRAAAVSMALFGRYHDVSVATFFARPTKVSLVGKFWRAAW